VRERERNTQKEGDGTSQRIEPVAEH